MTCPVRPCRSVRLHFRPVDRDDTCGDEPCGNAKPEHLGEQLGDRLGVAAAEAGEGRVVELLVRRDDAECDVFSKTPLDPTRGALADAVGIEEHGELEGRVVGGATPAVLPVIGVEGGEIELGHDVKNEERDVILGQPLRERRREQIELVAVDLAQIDRHAPSSRAPRNASRTVGIHATASDLHFPG